MTDPYAPPQWVPPSSATPRRRRALLAWMAGALAIVVVAALAALALHRSPTTDPRGVVRDYLAAAQHGDAAAMARLTAPSQRGGVHVSTLPYAATSVRLGGEPALGRPEPVLLSVDEMTVGLSVRACLQPGDRCGDLIGAGGEENVLVVREAGRWWMTARPFTLHVRQPVTPAVAAHVSTRLHVSGGLTLDVTSQTDVRDHHCATLGWQAFELLPGDSGTFVDVTTPTGTLRAGSTRLPAYNFSVQDPDHIGVEFDPPGPVTVTVSADHHNGVVAIHGWATHEVFDSGPAHGRAPLEGQLSFTCTDS